MRCSLLVLNYDERELLLECVESMLHAVGPSDEIIVIDNGSSDGSADAVGRSFPSVRVLRLAENRFIFSLNAGLSVARGEFVAFCNNDMLVEDKFAKRPSPVSRATTSSPFASRVVDRSGREQGTRTAGYWKQRTALLPIP